MRVNRTELLLSSLVAWIVTTATTAAGAAPIKSLPPCVRTPAVAIRTLAGNHLRFSIPIQAAPGVAVKYKPSTPKLLSQMHRYPAVIIRARAGKGYLNGKSPEDALYLDVYTTVDATAGESLLDVPLSFSGTLNGCAVVRSLKLRLEVSQPDLMDGFELDWIHERLELGGLFTYEHRDFLKREGSKGPRSVKSQTSVPDDLPTRVRAGTPLPKPKSKIVQKSTDGDIGFWEAITIDLYEIAIIESAPGFVPDLSEFDSLQAFEKGWVQEYGVQIRT